MEVVNSSLNVFSQRCVDFQLSLLLVGFKQLNVFIDFLISVFLIVQKNLKSLPYSESLEAVLPVI